MLLKLIVKSGRSRVAPIIRVVYAAGHRSRDEEVDWLPQVVVGITQKFLHRQMSSVTNVRQMCWISDNAYFVHCMTSHVDLHVLGNVHHTV